MTTDDLPQWADPEASRSLPEGRARGEGPLVDFKEAFPDQATKLGKVIAGFASTDGGTIFIGVRDDGDLVGLPEGETAAGRDSLTRRLEGICNGTVKPPVYPLLKWAIENDKVVMVVAVPRGPQPIYYAADVPYVRHLSSARPAQPQEVIEHILAWARASPAAGMD